MSTIRLEARGRLNNSDIYISAEAYNNGSFFFRVEDSKTSIQFTNGYSIGIREEVIDVLKRISRERRSNRHPNQGLTNDR